MSATAAHLIATLIVAAVYAAVLIYFDIRQGEEFKKRIDDSTGMINRNLSGLEGMISTKFSEVMTSLDAISRRSNRSDLEKQVRQQAQELSQWIVCEDMKKAKRCADNIVRILDGKQVRPPDGSGDLDKMEADKETSKRVFRMFSFEWWRNLLS